jgi:hypothetical protein
MNTNARLIDVGAGDYECYAGNTGGGTFDRPESIQPRVHMSQWLVAVAVVAGMIFTAYALLFAVSLPALAWYSAGATCAFLMAARWALQLRDSPCMLEL